MSVLCPQCGAPAKDGANKCEYCGAAIAAQPQPQVQAQPQYQPQPQVVVVQQQAVSERDRWPVKSKMAAALLAFFLGGLGIHKFYLGQGGAGILYLLFCWTGIPAFLALIDFIMLLCSSDDAFERKYRCRVN